MSIQNISQHNSLSKYFHNLNIFIGEGSDLNAKQNVPELVNCDCQ